MQNNPSSVTGHSSIGWVRVMADYGATTWDADGAAIDLQDYFPDPDIQQRLKAWERWFWKNLDDDGFDADERRRFDREGLEIARLVKARVGPNITVEYRPIEGEPLNVASVGKA